MSLAKDGKNKWVANKAQQKSLYAADFKGELGAGTPHPGVFAKERVLD
jgi:hypothetical protein